MSTEPSKDEEPKAFFITEHGGRLFKVLGGYTIELADGSKVTINPQAVIDAPVTEQDAKDRREPK